MSSSIAIALFSRRDSWWQLWAGEASGYCRENKQDAHHLRKVFAVVRVRAWPSDELWTADERDETCLSAAEERLTIIRSNQRERKSNCSIGIDERSERME